MTSAAPLRLIPARAGKTTRRRASPPTSRAHPRAGGENRSAPVENRQQEGSSPRGRGKHSHAIPERLHPSSSPRGRGKLEVWSEGSLRWRLIPARAGKTRRILREVRPRQAHPRAGGENAPPLRRTLVPTGSSPRGRGKRMASLPRPAPSRLIPARAGKTFPGWLNRGARRAHPRAGGESGAWLCGCLGLWGSSPRGRGKRYAIRRAYCLR